MFGLGSQDLAEAELNEAYQNVMISLKPILTVRNMAGWKNTCKDCCETVPRTKLFRSWIVIGDTIR